jgi:pimeloyl-ACP methyl ester carboxylesterase
VETWVEVADGVRLLVRRWPGDPARVPFLLVHGLASNSRLWEGVAGGLSAAGHPCYAVDLRSHGGSDRTPDGHDTSTAAADVAAVHSALGLPPVIATGQSWGGNVVVELAARQPAAVAALALVDGGWLDLSASFPSWEACERSLRPPDVDGRHFDDLISYFRIEHPDWAEWAIQATAANLAVDAAGRLSRRLPIPQHMRIVRSMWDDPPWPYLAKISVPALLVPATPADGTVPPAVGRAAAALTDATVKPYPGADHDLHAQHPDRLAADLLDLAGRIS